MPEITQALKLIVSVLNTEIFRLQNEPVSLMKLLISILIIGLGFPISKKITKLISNKVFNKFSLSFSVISTLEKFVFYTLIAFFFLFGLRTANIPLTVFNLIGGILAIGLGFGSKEVMSNFISGIIILFEKPIKIGDFVKIDEYFGKVDSIGIRSTKITTLGNKHLIVPNSKFLENYVDNWSFRDSKIRSSVKFGVSYGSDIDLVEKLTVECVLEQPRILKNKDDIKFLFTEFGESSLDFEVRYFILIEKHLDEKEISSELRKSMLKAFRKNNISIPFPQRDLHIIKQEE